MTRALYVLCFVSFFLLSEKGLTGPFDLSYGGRLVDTSGKPVSGPITIRAQFFREATGGDPISISLSDQAGVPLNQGEIGRAHV